MRYLFIHQNFPGQFRHIARALAQRGHAVVSVGSEIARSLDGIRLIKYPFKVPDVSRTHPFARTFDIHAHRADRLFNALSALKAEGFEPDVVVVHSGWGECSPVRALFRDARVIAYCEFYYSQDDLNFDPELPTVTSRDFVEFSLRNASNLLALADADAAVTPTQWQKSLFPSEFQTKINVIHEGIDTDIAAPSASAFVQIGERRFNFGDEVITYVARNLEPVRGFHIFMRALPEIMRRRPNAHVLVVGGDRVSYSTPAPEGKTWREFYLRQMEHRIDLSRIHFLGVLKYSDYLHVLKVSAVHIYLTHPFVLSWSVLEAMSTGCIVVASDTGPLREVIGESNGFKVPFHDVEQLARTVADCAADRRTLQGIRDRARADVKSRFDLGSVCLPRMVNFLNG